MVTLKSQRRQLKRALAKCRRFRDNEVHAYCTPTEYFILCDYLGVRLRRGRSEPYEPGTTEHRVWVRKKNGDSEPCPHYFRVFQEVAEQFEKSPYWSP